MLWKADEHEQAVKHWKEVEPMGEAGLAMAGWEFYRTRCPSLLMYGASQGEAAKSGYSKITPGLAPPKKRTAMLWNFFVIVKPTFYWTRGTREESNLHWGERAVPLKAIGLSALLVRRGEGVKGAINVDKNINDCKNFKDWTSRPNKAILIGLSMLGGGC